MSRPSKAKSSIVKNQEDRERKGNNSFVLPKDGRKGWKPPVQGVTSPDANSSCRVSCPTPP
jgi:hypothetical protein